METFLLFFSFFYLTPNVDRDSTQFEITSVPLSTKIIYLFAVKIRTLTLYKSTHVANINYIQNQYLNYLF